MTVHFHKELEHLRKQILAECVSVQDALIKAVTALLERNAELAQQVIEGDDEVDRMEVEFEEACLKVLALHQPVAHDLRFIVATLKMNNDLELMGDLTVNIAKRARFLCNHGPMAWPAELRPMFDNVKAMINGAMDALIATDADKARDVIANDNVVDDQKRKVMDILRRQIKENPNASEVLLKMLDVPRYLERIADLSTHIAEDVIYLVEGKISRHGFDEETA